MTSVVAGSYFPPYPPLDDVGKVDDKGGGENGESSSDVVKKDRMMKEGGTGVRVTVKATTSSDMDTNPMPSTGMKVAGHGVVVEREVGGDSFMAGSRNRVPRL